MSNSIDQRIVQMEFDNAQFEKGVKTTLDSLKTLENGLQFKDGAKGVSNIENALSRINMDGLITKTEGLESKFNLLGVTAANAIQRISNSILDVGENMLRGVTIQPILDGLDEYNTKLNSVQTIMTNTSAAFKDAGKSDAEHIQAVNDTISELNTYADKTIYNFSEMTRNIGTFTAAGVGLEQSSQAIQGIANLAASSGSSSEQASHAMYQLSQALSSGTVRLQDWVSVVNSGMGGKLFQDALIRTSEAFHRVNEESISAKESIAKHGSFRESLKDQWLTSDVLTETLNNFRLFYEGMSADDEKAARDHLKALKYTDEEIERIKEESLEAYDAATKVKSFDQLIDTTKEALGSGWGVTWEYIIGNLEQARALFTPISETINGFITKMDDARNSVLKVWSLGDDTHASGRDALVEGLQSLGEAILKLMEPLGKALDNVFGNLSADGLIDMSLAFRDMANGFKDFITTSPTVQAALNGLEIVFTALFTVVKAVGVILGGSFLVVLTAVGFAFQTVGLIVSSIADGIGKVLALLASNFTNVAQGISEFGKGLAEATGLKPLVQFFNGLGMAVENVAKQLSGESFSEWHLLTGLQQMQSAATRLVGPLMKLAGDNIIKPLENLFSIVGSSVSEAVFNGLATAGENLANAFQTLAANAGPLVEYVKGLGSSFADLTGISEMIPFFESFGTVIEHIANVITGNESMDDMSESLASLGTAAGALSGPLSEMGSSTVENGVSILGTVLSTLGSIASMIPTAVMTAVGAALFVLGNALTFLFNTVSTIAGPIIDFFKNFAASIVETNLGGKISKIATELKEGIGEAIASVTDFSDTGQINQLGNKIGSLLDKAADNIGIAVKSFAANLAQKISGDGPLSGIFEAIGTVGEKIAHALEGVKAFLSGFGGSGFEATGIGDFFASLVGIFSGGEAEQAKENVEAMGDIAEEAQGAFDMLAFFQNLPVSIGEGLADFVNSIGAGIDAFLAKVNGEKIAKFVGSLASLGISAGVVVSLYNLSKGIRAIGEIAESFGDIADHLKNIAKMGEKMAKAARMNLMASAIKSLAISIGIIAASIVVLTYIDHQKMYEAVPVLLGIVAVIGVMMFVMQKLADEQNTIDPKKMLALSASVSSFAFAVAIMAGVITLLSVLPVNSKGIGTVVGIIGGFIALMKYTDKLVPSEFKKARQIIHSIEELGFSLIVMWAAIELLGHMDQGTAKQGIGAIGIILLLIGAMGKLMASGKGLGSGAGQLLAVSKAMSNAAILVAVCGVVVRLLGGMDLGQMMQGIIGVGLLLIIVGLLIKLMASVQVVPGGLTTAAGTLLAMAVAIAIFAGAISLLAMVSAAGGNVIGAVITLGLALLALVGVCVLITDLSGPMVAAAGAILIIVVALAAFAVVIVAFSAIPWEVLIRGLTMFVPIFAVAIGVFAAFAAVAQALIVGVIALSVGFIAFGVGLVLVAAALLIGAAAMAIFTAIAPQFVPAFIEFTNALVALFQTEDFVGSIIGTAIAMTLLGVACLALGIGLGVLGLVVNAMPGTFTKVATDILNAIMLITTGITAMGPQIANAITTALTSIVMGVVGFISNMWQLATSLAQTFAEGLKNFDWAGAAYSLVTTLGGALIGALQFLVQDLPGIVMEIGSGIMDGIGELLQDPLSDFGNWLSDITGIGEKTSEEVQEQLDEAKAGYAESKEQLNDTIREGNQETADAITEGGDQAADAAAQATANWQAKMDEQKAAMSGGEGGQMDILSMLNLGDIENMDVSAITDALGNKLGVEVPAELGQKIKDGANGEDLLGAFSEILDPEQLTSLFGEQASQVDMEAVMSNLGGGEGGGFDMSGIIAQDVDPEAMSEKAHEAATAFTDTFNEDMNSGIDINVMDSITAAFDPGALQEAFSGMFAEVDLGAAFGENLSAQLGSIDIGASLNLDAASLSRQANEAVKAVTDPLNKLGDMIKPNLAPSMNQAINQVKQSGKFRAAASEDGRAVVAGFNSGSSGMRSAGANAGNAAASGVKGTASSGKSAGYSVGSDIGQGLVNGLKAKEDAAYQAGYRVGKAAVKGQKAGASSNSPSKIAIQTGKDIGEGLVIGVLAMKDSVYNAGYSTGSAAVASLNDATLSMGSLFDGLSDIDDQPTIRPVLDLTDYEAGINRMRGLGVGDQMVKAQWANRLGAQAGGLGGNSKSTQNNINITLDWKAGASANQMVQEMANVLQAKNLMEA